MFSILLPLNTYYISEQILKNYMRIFLTENFDKARINGGIIFLMIECVHNKILYMQHANQRIL